MRCAHLLVSIQRPEVDRPLLRSRRKQLVVLTHGQGPRLHFCAFASDCICCVPAGKTNVHHAKNRDQNHNIRDPHKASRQHREGREGGRKNRGRRILCSTYGGRCVDPFVFFGARNRLCFPLVSCRNLVPAAVVGPLTSLGTAYRAPSRLRCKCENQTTK